MTLSEGRLYSPQTGERDENCNFKILNFSVMKLEQSLIFKVQLSPPVDRDYSPQGLNKPQHGPLETSIHRLTSVESTEVGVRCIYLLSWKSPLLRKLIASTPPVWSKQTNECLKQIIETPLKFGPYNWYISTKTRQLLFLILGSDFLVVVSSVDLAAC